MAVRYYIALLGLLLSPVVNAANLSSIDIPGEVYSCTGSQRYIRWTPTENVYITSVRIWTGVSIGTRADIDLNVTIDGVIFHGAGWDRYGDTDGIPDQILDLNFTPHWVYLPAGKTVELRSFCMPGTNVLGGVQHVVHHLAVWYFKEQ